MDVHLCIAHVLLGSAAAVSGVAVVRVVRAGVLGTARDFFSDRLEGAEREQAKRGGLHKQGEEKL